MGKLHELLAVEPDLKGQAQRDLTQVASLFGQGQGRLEGKQRTYQPLDDEGEQLPAEVDVMATNVEAELLKVRQTYGRWMDAAVQKEATNADTSAEIEGLESVGWLPAPALLNLESKLAELRKLYAAIPTNDPTEQWEWSEAQNCFVSQPRVTRKTQKVPKSHIAHPPTKEHPAQVTTYMEDVTVGHWTTLLQSGKITPTAKRQMLERLDTLARAVKQARQRANTAEVDAAQVSAAIFDFIEG